MARHLGSRITQAAASLARLTIASAGHELRGEVWATAPVGNLKMFDTGNDLPTGLAPVNDGPSCPPPARGAGSRAAFAPVGVFLNGETIGGRDQRGQRIVDDSFLLIFNAHDEPVEWIVPTQYGDRWDIVLDTGAASIDDGDDSSRSGGSTISVAGRSVVVLSRG